MRMTVQEMAKKYPDRWIGISNVETSDNGSVVSGEVVFTDRTASELAMMSIRNEGVRPHYTTPNNTFHVGAIL